MLTIATGTGIAQIIVVASSPILTRLYTPADYGVFSVATAMMAILIAVTCLRYEFAVPLPEADETAANVVALALLVDLGLGMASFVFLGLAGAPILAFFGAAALGPYVFLITLEQLAGGATSTLVSWAVRTKTFSEIAAFRLTQAVVVVGAQVGLGVAGLGTADRGSRFADNLSPKVSLANRIARSCWLVMVLSVGAFCPLERLGRSPCR